MLVLDYRYKFAAALLALSLHLAAAVALGWSLDLKRANSAGVATAIGHGGIEIGLASMAVKPATVKKKPQPKPKPVEKKEAAKISKEKPVEVEAIDELEDVSEQRLPESSGNEGGGVPLTEKNYMSTLQVWLERHKKYPYQARRLNMEGTTLLYFEIDRDGNLLRHYIQESSGHSLLDQEVLAMIERAQPLPAMPPDMKNETLILVLPVQFSLR